jgi:putative membrane-bound dehydrogenase-like protein
MMRFVLVSFLALGAWLGSLAVGGFAVAEESPLRSTPLSVDEARAAFQLDEQLTIENVASEPDVESPVFIAFDPRQRMWVVEMRDYPNGPPAGQPGTSRIKVLTRQADGRYGEPKIFADGLLFANSLMFWQDGVIVTTDGRIDFLADRDGDGKAEFRETWFKGFARENPQLRVNHPTLGLDGWIYVSNGLRGGSIVAVRPDWAKPVWHLRQPVQLGARDFRFNPFTGEAETTTGFGQFGMTFDDFGHRFFCSNRNPCVQAVIPEDALKMNPDVTVPAVTHDVVAAGEASKIYPISKYWVTSNLHAGQFTAACGVRIYRGDALPSEFYGNVFTCDPTGNLVHREILSRPGVVFVGKPAYEGKEFLASTDPWCRPVNLTVGPDGALYVVDMCRAVIEHPEYMPEELRTRPDLVLGKTCGRIWRIVPKEPREIEANRAIDPDSRDSLIAALDHPNVWQRETAFRLLYQLQSSDLATSLERMFASANQPAGKVSCLALLGAIGRLDALTNGIRSPDPNVQEFSVQLLGTIRQQSNTSPKQHAPVSALGQNVANAIVQDWVKDFGSKEHTVSVNFQLALALGRIDSGKRGTLLLGWMLRSNPEDVWLATAVALAAKADLHLTISFVLSGGLGFEPLPLDRAAIPSLSMLMASLGSQDQPEGFIAPLTMVEEFARRQGTSQLLWLDPLWHCLGRGLRSRGRSPRDAFQLAWNGSRDGRFTEFAELALDVGHDRDARLAAVKLLEFGTFRQVAATLSELVESPDSEIAFNAISTLSTFNDPGAAETLVKNFDARSPRLQREIITAMLQGEPRVAVLLDEIEAGRIPAGELTPVRLQQLAAIQNPELKARIAVIAEKNKPADRAEVLAAYKVALETTGDPAHGREVFTKNCAQCHKIGSIGVNVAPDISDSRVKQPSQLLVDILDPNRAIDNNYFSYIVADVDGVVQTGVVAAETATSITLKQPEAKLVTIPRDRIESMKSTGQSLMPVGLEKTVSTADMADLISFIKNWRYLDGSAPKEVIR